MASIVRGPPPFLQANGTGNGSTSAPTADKKAEGGGRGQEVRGIPGLNSRKSGPVTPVNTPAQPPPVIIAPRMGGGRPIGLGLGRGGGGAGTPHAVTPGNTPSSLETMGRRIAGKLQGGGGSGLTSPTGARIAPSYERRLTAGLQDLTSRLATHPETSLSADSPSSSMQRLQIVSPASTEQGGKADWPTSFDTDTNDGNVQEKEGKDDQKAE